MNAKSVTAVIASSAAMLMDSDWLAIIVDLHFINHRARRASTSVRCRASGRAKARTTGQSLAFQLSMRQINRCVIYCVFKRTVRVERAGATRESRLAAAARATAAARPGQAASIERAAACCGAEITCTGDLGRAATRRPTGAKKDKEHSRQADHSVCVVYYFISYRMRTSRDWRSHQSAALLYANRRTANRSMHSRGSICLCRRAAYLRLRWTRFAEPNTRGECTAS